MSQAKFLEKAQQAEPDTRPLGPDSSVLELGAGTGLVGVAALQLIRTSASGARAGAGAMPASTTTHASTTTTTPAPNPNHEPGCHDAAAREGVPAEVVITDVAAVVPTLEATIALNDGPEEGTAAAGGGVAGVPAGGGQESGKGCQTRVVARAAPLDWTQAAADLAALQAGSVRRRWQQQQQQVGGKQRSASSAGYDVILAADVVSSHVPLALPPPGVGTTCCTFGRAVGAIARVQAWCAEI